MNACTKIFALQYQVNGVHVGVDAAGIEALGADCRCVLVKC